LRWAFVIGMPSGEIRSRDGIVYGGILRTDAQRDRILFFRTGLIATALQHRAEIVVRFKVSWTFVDVVARHGLW